LSERIDYDSEWAYWIDQKSLKLKKHQKTIPIGSIVLTKTRGVTDEGIKYVDTSFGIAESSGVREIPKKEANRILSMQMLEYMKTKAQWPPAMSTKDLLKNGDIEILFKPSEYDSFVLKLTSKMVKHKPIDFLDALKDPEKEPEPVWKIEAAKSGRSKCRTCGKIIDEGRFRIGEPYLYEDHLTYRWHHAKCIGPALDVPIEKMDGYRFLEPDEKLRLKKLLK